MTQTRCACKGCVGTVAAGANQPYCCKACADRHPTGLEHCHDPACHCGKNIEESQLDEALDETFPASDPIAP